MDRCTACKAQTYFYGIQTSPVFTRWVVCYDCRGVKSGTGSSDMYIFTTDTGHTGYTSKAPSKGMFKSGKQIQDEVRESER